MEKTVEILVTNRPIRASFMGIATLGIRAATNSPFNHSMIRDKNWVYESTAVFGVQKVSLREWEAAHEGAYLFVWTVPIEDVDFELFNRVQGQGYDYLSLWYFIRGKWSKMRRRAKRKNKWFCSKLTARMLGLKDPYLYAPDHIERYCTEKYGKANIEVINND